MANWNSVGASFSVNGVQRMVGPPLGAYLGSVLSRRAVLVMGGLMVLLAAYLAHPLARYFSVGRVGRDQVEDYAGRKGMAVDEAERWLRPNLGYELRVPAEALNR